MWQMYFATVILCSYFNCVSLCVVFCQQQQQQQQQQQTQQQQHMMHTGR